MRTNLADPRLHRILLIIAAVIAAVLLAVLALLAFGIGLMRPTIENRLSAALGRRVTIAAIRREGAPSLTPHLAIEGVRIAQPDWLTGDMITIRRVDLRLPLLPLLAGHVRPGRVAIDGLRVHLVRRDATYANWKGLGGSGGGGSGGRATLITIHDGQLIFDDFKRQHVLRGTIAADDRGFRLAAGGTLLGRPARALLVGAPLAGGRPWPFRLDYRAPIANAVLVARAAAPLDIGHFEGDVRAWGDDLKHLDQLVEAGLPGTRPVRLTAHLRHDRPDWTIGALDIAIGRSRATGDITVAKRGDRTRVDGALTAAALDFDDLANDTGRARAAAKRAVSGDRVLPDTAIDLTHLLHTDARLTIDVRQLLFAGPSTFRAMRGTLTLDHGLLVADPFVATLTPGTLAGTVRVDQRDGPPRLAIDLRLRGANVARLLGNDMISAPLDGRFVIAGRGRTIRSAIAHGSGRAALVARAGTLNRRLALFLGTDVGRAVFADKSDRSALHCTIASFTLDAGTARPTPLLVDTAVSRMEGSGRIDLGSEAIALGLTGKPKLANAISLTDPIRIGGTLRHVDVIPPDVPKTVGTVLKMVGKAIAGKKPPPPPDADCGALAAQALR